MEWKTVKIEKTRRGSSSPYASIGIGKIALSYGACALIVDYPKYKFAQLLVGNQNGKKVIGIRLLEEDAENCLKINKRKLNGEIIAYSGSLDNKPLMEQLFGAQGVALRVKRYAISLDSDDRNVLVIHLED